jgi:hypothetical protein
LLANSEENVVAIEPKLGENVIEIQWWWYEQCKFWTTKSNNNALFLLLFLLFRDSLIHVQESFRGPKPSTFFPCMEIFWTNWWKFIKNFVHKKNLGSDYFFGGYNVSQGWMRICWGNWVWDWWQ